MQERRRHSIHISPAKKKATRRWLFSYPYARIGLDMSKHTKSGTWYVKMCRQIEKVQKDIHIP